LRSRVENKLEPESKSNALKTLETLKNEAIKNSSIVADVEGKKFTEARDMLMAVGLRVQPEMVSRTGIVADLVIDQTPVPGARVLKGTVVKLKVVMSGTPAKAL